MTTNIDKFGKLHKSKHIMIGNCVFPFKHNRQMVNTCVDGKTGLWCATEVDSKGKVLKWAYCPQTKVKISKKSSTSPVVQPKKTQVKKTLKVKPKSVTPVKESTQREERYFENVEGEQFKFWIIKIMGSQVITKFGKIGGVAKEVKSNFDTPKEAEKYESKKVLEKLRKGYVEKNNVSNRTNSSKKPIKKSKVSGAVSKGEPISLSPKTKDKISANVVKCQAGPGNSVWDVKTKGVMLAHTYKDPKTGKIKNPVKGYPKAPNGWYMSEKYDGYRAIWDGDNFYSRAGNLFVVPKWFKAFLPPGIALDGELFLGRECFQQCGIFRRKTPNDDEWIKSDVKYQIFDSPTHPGKFEERQDFIQK